MMITIKRNAHANAGRKNPNKSILCFVSLPHDVDWTLHFINHFCLKLIYLVRSDPSFASNIIIICAVFICFSIWTDRHRPHRRRRCAIKMILLVTHDMMIDDNPIEILGLEMSQTGTTALLTTAICTTWAWCVVVSKAVFAVGTFHDPEFPLGSMSSSMNYYV